MDRKARYDEKLLMILDRASSLIARKGYHNTSIRDVAAETGVSPAGLYYYFESKDELLHLILDSCFSPLMERMRNEVAVIEDPAVRLRTLIRTHLDHFKDNGEEMRVLVHEWRSASGAYGSKIRDLMREYVEVATRLFRELFPEKDAQQLRASVFGLFGMLSWVDRWYRPGRDLPLDLLANEFASIVLQGVPARGKGRRDPDRSKETSDGEWSEKSSTSSILSGPGF